MRSETALNLSSEGFAALARERLRAEPPMLGDVISRPRGDHEHQSAAVPIPDEKRAVPAAVLIGIVPRPEGPTVLLTQRAAVVVAEVMDQHHGTERQRHRVVARIGQRPLHQLDAERRVVRADRRPAHGWQLSIM